MSRQLVARSFFASIFAFCFLLIGAASIHAQTASEEKESTDQIDEAHMASIEAIKAKPFSAVIKQWAEKLKNRELDPNDESALKAEAISTIQRNVFGASDYVIIAAAIGSIAAMAAAVAIFFFGSQLGLYPKNSLTLERFIVAGAFLTIGVIGEWSSIRILGSDWAEKQRLPKATAYWEAQKEDLLESLKGFARTARSPKQIIAPATAPKKLSSGVLNQFTENDFKNFFLRATASGSGAEKLFDIKDLKLRQEISRKLSESTVLKGAIRNGEKFFADYLWAVEKRLGDLTSETRGLLLEPAQEMERSLNDYARRYIHMVERNRPFEVADREAREAMIVKYSIDPNLAIDRWEIDYSTAYDEYRRLLNAKTLEEIMRIEKTTNIPPSELAKWKYRIREKLLRLSKEAEWEANTLLTDNDHYRFKVKRYTERPAPSIYLRFLSWLFAEPAPVSKDMDLRVFVQEAKSGLTAQELQQFLDANKNPENRIEIEVHRTWKGFFRDWARNLGRYTAPLLEVPTSPGWGTLKKFLNISLLMPSQSLDWNKRASLNREVIQSEENIVRALNERDDLMSAERAEAQDLIDRAKRLQNAASLLDPNKYENLNLLRMRIRKARIEGIQGSGAETIAKDLARKGVNLFGDELAELQMSGFERRVESNYESKTFSPTGTHWQIRDRIAEKNKANELKLTEASSPPKERWTREFRLNRQNGFVQYRPWARRLLAAATAFAVYTGVFASAAFIYDFYTKAQFEMPNVGDGISSMLDQPVRIAYKLNFVDAMSGKIVPGDRHQLKGYYDLAEARDVREYDSFVTSAVVNADWAEQNLKYVTAKSDPMDSTKDLESTRLFRFDLPRTDAVQNLQIGSSTAVRITSEIPGAAIPVKAGQVPKTVTISVNRRDLRYDPISYFHVIYDKQKQVLFVWVSPEGRLENLKFNFEATFAPDLPAAAKYANYNGRKVADFQQREKDLFSVEPEKVKFVANVLEALGDTKISGGLNAFNKIWPTSEIRVIYRLETLLKSDAFYSYVKEHSVGRADSSESWPRLSQLLSTISPTKTSEQDAALHLIDGLHAQTRFFNDDKIFCYQCDGAAETGEIILNYLYSHGDSDEARTVERPIVEGHPNFYNDVPTDGDEQMLPPEKLETLEVLTTNEAHARTILRSEDGLIRESFDFTPWRMDPRNPKKSPAEEGAFMRFFRTLKSRTPSFIADGKAFNKEAGQMKEESQQEKESVNLAERAKSIWKSVRNFWNSQFPAQDPIKTPSKPIAEVLSQMELLPLKKSEDEMTEMDLHLKQVALEADLLPDGPSFHVHETRMQDLEVRKSSVIKNLKDSHAEGLLLQGELVPKLLVFSNLLKRYSSNEINFAEFLRESKNLYPHLGESLRLQRGPNALLREKDLRKVLLNWRIDFAKTFDGILKKAEELRLKYDRSRTKSRPPEVETIYLDLNVQEHIKLLADQIIQTNWTPVNSLDLCKLKIEALMQGRKNKSPQLPL